MSAPVDRAALEKAIVNLRDRDRLTAGDADALLAAAEAHLATLPEPKDCVVVLFDAGADVISSGFMTRAKAEALAAERRVAYPEYRYVVVQRPA